MNLNELKKDKIGIKDFKDDYLKSINLKVFDLTFDKAFKGIFELNYEALKRFVISVTHLTFKPEDIDIKFIAPSLPITKFYEYQKTMDMHVVINDSIDIGIEVNRNSFSSVKLRNFLFLNKNYSLSLKSGNKKKKLEDLTYIQLNLNTEDKSSNIGEDIIFPYSMVKKEIYIENYIIYLRYLDYYHRLYYNENVIKSEADYWLAALSAKDIVTFNKILKCFLDDELRIKLVKDAINMFDNESIIDEYEQMMLYRVQERETKKYAIIEGLKEGREKGREEGLKEGLEQGAEQNTIKMIKSMLKNDADYEFISNVTGKTIEEIKEIEKQ